MFNCEDDDNANNKSELSDIGGFFQINFLQLEKAFLKEEIFLKKIILMIFVIIYLFYHNIKIK